MVDTTYQGPGDYLKVNVVKDLSNNTKTVEAELMTVNGTYPRLPKDIFLYSNLGNGVLGEYQKVVNKEELFKTEVFTPGVPLPLFGNRYVRHSKVIAVLAFNDDETLVINHIKTSIKSLSLEMSATANSEQVIYIP